MRESEVKRKTNETEIVCKINLDGTGNSIINIYKVNENAHSRYDDISRTYQYDLLQQKNSFKHEAYLVHKKLDLIAMNKACSLLLGQQDFTSFSII